MALAYDAQPTQEQLSDEQEQIRRQEKLLRMLKAEEEDALGYAESEIQGQQIEALKRYNGEKYGDEEEGRSQVTTREVFETIEWQRNDYARVLNDGGKLVYADEQREEHAKQARAAEDYMQWIIFVDNPGYFLLDDFTFDGLLHRRGYLAAYWCDREYQAPYVVSGLNIMQVQELVADPEVEIVGQNFDEESEAGGISLKIRRLKHPARVKIDSFAPEDVRITGRFTDIDEGRYLGLVRRKLRGEIVREWPAKREEIMGWSGGDAGTGGFRRSEDVRAQRFNDDSDSWDDAADEPSQELEVLEEYLRVDLDGDGYPELIRSYRLGDIILEEEEVPENPVGTWTPIRMPHRFMGLSVHDITADLQRIGTVLMRAGLDATYQNVVPREAYDRNRVNADSLLSTYAGSKVDVDGDPATAIQQLPTNPNTSQVAWEALEINKQRLEDRTGATRQTRGLDADQLSKEHSGKALGMLQLSADARKELTARNLAAGLSAFVCKVHRLVCRNQNEPRQVKIGGKYCVFDSRTWNSELKLQFHVAGLNREHSLVGLRLIGEEQEKVVEMLGPGNPNVTMKNRGRYQEELCRFAGQKDSGAFFTEVPDEPEVGPDGQPVIDPETGAPKMKPWAPPPQEDPAMAKVKIDAAAQQEQMKLDVQKTQAGLALQQQRDTAEMASAEQEAALKLSLQREESAAKIALEREKAAAEMQLAWAKFEAEMALAREKQAAEIDMRREELAHQREMHTEDNDAKREMHSEKVDADVKISKNREGGDLSE
jgi:hypothetical protein